jgi:ADP-ribose pyrophosphatase YjhB (NUDIX family)
MMLYDLLKICVSICFNLLNKLLRGKLPPFSSAGVIVEQQDHYLVIELPRGRVAFPAGFSTWRETPQQTAEREGKEETGYLLRAEDMIGYYPCPSYQLTAMSTTCLVYAARIIGGELKNNREGHPRWLHEHELRKRLSAHSRMILDDYLQYRWQQRAKDASLKTNTLPLAS